MLNMGYTDQKMFIFRDFLRSEQLLPLKRYLKKLFFINITLATINDFSLTLVYIFEINCDILISVSSWLFMVEAHSMQHFVEDNTRN